VLDELWELFQRVVPDVPTRPQGGGRRRHGDREVLAAIICGDLDWSRCAIDSVNMRAMKRGS
jgi:hypothetical protein